MDTSFWTQLSPNVINDPTSKRFFSRYLCRLVIMCQAGRIINDNADSIEEALRIRRSTQKSYNYGGSWWHRQQADLDKANVEQLKEIQAIKMDYRDSCRIRVEEPWIQIYTEDEATLKVIAKRLEPYADRFLSVSVPKSKEHELALKSDRIILKTSSKIKHSYKVMFRDGMYSTESKLQILNYLDQMGDAVSVSKGTRSMLSKDFGYIWGCFIYVNDLSLVTFIGLIQPNIVGKIYELVRLNQ